MDESLLEKIKYLNGQLALNAFFIKSLEAEIERLREVLKKTLDVARRNELGDYIQSAEAALQQKDQGQ